MFWPFTVWINCSNNFENFENSRRSASNFKSFSRSLEHFFLTVGQNNFGNKIPFLALALKLKIGSQQRKQRQTKKRFASLTKWTINVSRWIDLRKTAKMVQNGVRSYLKNHLFSYTCQGRFMMWKNTRKNGQRFSYLCLKCELQKCARNSMMAFWATSKISLESKLWSPQFSQKRNEMHSGYCPKLLSRLTDL